MGDTKTPITPQTIVEISEANHEDVATSEAGPAFMATTSEAIPEAQIQIILTETTTDRNLLLSPTKQNVIVAKVLVTHPTNVPHQIHAQTLHRKRN